MKVIWTLFKQNKYINLLNIIVSTIFLLLLVVLIINLDQSNLETSTARNFKDKNVYQISDSLIEDKETLFFQNKSSYDILHNFSNRLSKNMMFDYYSAIWQPIAVEDFKGDTPFLAYYEPGDLQDPYVMNGKSYSNVKSMRLNQTVFQLNNVQLASGKEFEEEAYIYHRNNDTVPIILGADYSKFYEIGDEIDIDYYDKEFTGIVTGFLKSFQTIMTNHGPEFQLDKYMILPVVNFSELPSSMLETHSEDEFFYKATLLTNTNGNMITKYSPLEIKGILEQLATETGFAEFSIIGANSVATDLLYNMTKQNKHVLYIVTFLLFAIMTTVFIFTFHLKIKKNVDTYAVLLMSGLNLGHIYKMVRSEFILTKGIGSILPIILLLYLTKLSIVMLINYLFVFAVFMTISMLLMNIVIKKTFSQIDIVQRLKG